jgi:hypothetical protein
MVVSKDLGGRFAGVRMRRVRAVSIGLSRSDEIVEEAVAINTLATGAVEVSIDVLGTAPAGDGLMMSDSEIPRIPAKNDLKNVSKVRRRIV